MSTTLQHAAAAASATKSSVFQRAHLYSSTVDSMSSAIATTLPESAPIWASNVLVFMQMLAMPLGIWFKPVVVTLATVWLVHRAYQVLNKPLEELASLLGFDIPLTPMIDLAGIKADGCLLHWSLPEKLKQRSKFRFEIHLNGTVIDTVSIQETAVNITGLQPSSFYVVRVALVNEQDLGSRSEPIRFRTKPASSGDYFVVPLDGHDTDQDGSGEILPRVRVHRGLKDVTPASIEAAPMAREGSIGLGPKRSITGRRPSPAALGLDMKHDPQPEESEPPEGAESLHQLTEKLDAIRRETDDTERQAKDEDEEESKLKDELTAERDMLREQVAEKEKASRTLKKEVNTLERQNTAAQNDRSKHERLLQQKKQERAKVKTDMVRWAKEAEDLRSEVERIQKDKEEHLQQVEHEKEGLRAKQAQEAAATRALEDEIKEKNAEIKRLERTMKIESPDQNGHSYAENTVAEPNLVQQMQQEAEEERSYQALRTQLMQQYASTAQKLEEAKRFYHGVNRYLEYVRAQRRLEEDRAAAQAAAQQWTSPSPADRMIRRGDSQRSRRAPSGHSASESPRMGGFPLAGAGGMQSGAGAFVNGFGSSAVHSAPFFNIHNGMTLRTEPVTRPGADEYPNMSEEDRERMTGGAPMSPGAGAELLPAGLFSGVDDDSRQERERAAEQQSVQILPGLGSLPGLPGLPGGPSPAVERWERNDHAAQGPASPGSTSSRSPSVFASPQASQNNLHLGSPIENFNIDADRRSIRSTRSNRAGTGTSGTPAAGSRFSSLFGIKQRTKTLSADEGPALGKAQSHSMPREEIQSLPGLQHISDGGPTARKRNSSISGLAFGNGDAFGGALGDGVPDSAFGSESGNALAGNQPAARRRPFSGMASIFSRDSKESSSQTQRDKDGTTGWPSTFTSSFGGLRRPGSPRPDSTHSNELPRPSVDSSRWGVGADAWPSIPDAAQGAARSSPLSFTVPWNIPQPGGEQRNRLYGSRHPSRRPSVQHGVSGPPEDIMEDEDSDAMLEPDDVVRTPQLAPIGTKPSSKTAVQAQAESSEQAAAAAASQEKKLNPAARAFNMFGIKSKDKAARAGSPSAAGAQTLTSSTSRTDGDGAGDEGSPPTSRKSRDARSMTTTESSIAESGELGTSAGTNGTYDLARTPSYSANSDATGPSPLIGSTTSKESFMAKLTRKSSSAGKTFSLPTFKREKSRLDPGPAAEIMAEEEDMSASVGSLREKEREREPRESKDGGNRSSTRSWSSVLKLGKGKKGGETPSLSGLSLASGTEDGDGSGEE
ncbi:hypothetical protein BAUCODRAFT_31000 [Baudoinia panamericana UAMH 10762]|uniref:Fibronectin type-III domain-containing protein n=1 Tax=Baudoinia panamericana (strain UAMH 10762) TaxID=717646 RepID=M2NI09_BAUPA|nr:uncharacterized protein BAUCODRAFT_31000 [Baudoinia panamericana UAMH 10762]EMC98720.1 hypothetical protein BAUCODRAFT_31000 [Baudoinia panamericana UAMH 10762]